MEPQQLSCPACGQTEYCRPPQLVARMQQLGMLRRAGAPEPEVVEALFPAALARFACARCGHAGLVAAAVEDEPDAWDEARICELCGQRIPAERMELFPQTRRCAACQQQGDAAAEEAEYCEKCGSLMQLRLRAGGGVTRYAMSCPQCRR